MLEELVRTGNYVMLVDNWDNGDVEDIEVQIGDILEIDDYADDMYDGEHFGFTCYETNDWIHNPNSFDLVFPSKFDQHNYDLKQSRDSGQGELYASTEI